MQFFTKYLILCEGLLPAAGGSEHKCELTQTLCQTALVKTGLFSLILLKTVLLTK